MDDQIFNPSQDGKPGQLSVDHHSYGARLQKFNETVQSSDDHHLHADRLVDANSAQADGEGHCRDDHHGLHALPESFPAAVVRAQPARLARQDGEGQQPGDHHGTIALPEQFNETVRWSVDIQQTSDRLVETDRFSDPLIAEITETFRQRQDMVRAQTKLILQAQAICRRFTAGDKKEAEKLYRAIVTGKPHPMADAAGIATLALTRATEPLEAQRKLYDKRLTALGEKLPIAHMATSIKGVSTKTLATIVGELGDLSAYDKGVAGIWKRAGLAVINGERQRKKTGDAALLHGYSPSRHATFWMIGDVMLKAQGKGENALPYRLIYDERKAYERPRVASDQHAHDRAMRFMVKRLLKHLWQAWRDAA